MRDDLAFLIYCPPSRKGGGGGGATHPLPPPSPLATGLPSRRASAQANIEVNELILLLFY